MVYIGSLSLKLKMTIHLAKKAQIALLFAKKVTVTTKYSDFADVFLKKLANVFSEQTKANKHAIKLKQGNQLSYGLIYSPKLVKFKIPKIYIENNLANGFIKTSKLPISSRILFLCKLNNSLYLYINYWQLNNLTIKIDIHYP